jgi:hypothetical protein
MDGVVEETNEEGGQEEAIEKGATEGVEGEATEGVANEEGVEVQLCCGYTEELISKNYRIQDNGKVAEGFKYLVGQGIHNYASAISNSVDWRYEIPIVGVIRQDGSDKYTVTATNKVHAIHAVDCSKTVPAASEASDSICRKCSVRGKYFFRRCRGAVDIRKDPIADGTRNDTLSSSILANEKFNADKKKKRALRQKFIRQQAKKMRRGGVCLPAGDVYDQLFDEKTEEYALATFSIRP